MTLNGSNSKNFYRQFPVNWYKKDRKIAWSLVYLKFWWVHWTKWDDLDICFSITDFPLLEYLLKTGSDNLLGNVDEDWNSPWQHLYSQKSKILFQSGGLISYWQIGFSKDVWDYPASKSPSSR